LKCDGTCTETRFSLSRETRPVHLNRPRGESVQSTAGSRVVRISGSNAGYTRVPRWCEGYWLPTAFTSFHLHFQSCASPCATTFQLQSTNLRQDTCNFYILANGSQPRRQWVRNFEAIKPVSMPQRMESLTIPNVLHDRRKTRAQMARRRTYKYPSK